MQSKTKPYFNFWDSVCDWNGIQAKMVNADFQWNLNASSYLSVFLSKILRNNTQIRFARICILFVSAQSKSKFNKIEFCILFAFHLFVLHNELEVIDMKPRWTNNECMLYVHLYIHRVSFRVWLSIQPIKIFAYIFCVIRECDYMFNAQFWGSLKNFIQS